MAELSAVLSRFQFLQDSIGQNISRLTLETAIPAPLNEKISVEIENLNSLLSSVEVTIGFSEESQEQSNSPTRFVVANRKELGAKLEQAFARMNGLFGTLTEIEQRVGRLSSLKGKIISLREHEKLYQERTSALEHEIRGRREASGDAFPSREDQDLLGRQEQVQQSLQETAQNAREKEATLLEHGRGLVEYMASLETGNFDSTALEGGTDETIRGNWERIREYLRREQVFVAPSDPNDAPPQKGRTKFLARPILGSLGALAAILGFAAWYINFQKSSKTSTPTLVTRKETRWSGQDYLRHPLISRYLSNNGKQKLATVTDPAEAQTLFLLLLTGIDQLKIAQDVQTAIKGVRPITLSTIPTGILLSVSDEIKKRLRESFSPDFWIGLDFSLRRPHGILRGQSSNSSTLVVDREVFCSGGTGRININFTFPHGASIGIRSNIVDLTPDRNEPKTRNPCN